MIRSFLRVIARSTNGGWSRIQFLQRVWKLGRMTLWVKTIDREEVPPHVVIEVCSLGSTFWRSKWCGMPEILWKPAKAMFAMTKRRAPNERVIR